MQIRQEDFEAYIEYFLDEEKKGVKEYYKFLELLPQDEKFKNIKAIIANILKDEQKHIFALKNML